jgi:hypothetical protein
MKEEVRVEHTAPRLAPSRVRRVSWGAIFAGLVVTMVVQMMLTLLGIAIGAATVSPLEQQNPTQGLALGSAIWLLASSLIAVWVGACVAGRLSGGPQRADGMIHGIVTWSASTLATLAMLATATGALLGGAGALLGGALASSKNDSGVTSSAMNSVGQSLREIFPPASKVLPPTGRPGSGETAGGQPTGGKLTSLAVQDPQIGTILARLESRGGVAQSPQDRDQLVNVLTSRHNVSQPEAVAMVNQWDQQFQQVKSQTTQKAREAGDTAARGISQGALWGFIALVLGLLVAAWGGWAGTASLPRPLEAATVRS